MKENINKINWFNLSENPNGFEILKDYPEKIDFFYLCSNTSSEAIRLLRSNLDKPLNWSALSENPAAVSILEENIENIDWETLCENPNAINLLEQNKDKIDYRYLLTNPSVFEIDYQEIKRRKEHLTEGIMKKCYHPNRLVYYLEKFNYDIGDDEYITDW